MIEKMKYVNITGPAAGIDDVIRKYISKFDIQLEYTVKEFTNEKRLTAFNDRNPYADILKSIDKYADFFKKGTDEVSYGEYAGISENEAVEIISRAAEYFESGASKISALKKEKEICEEYAERFRYFCGLDFAIEDLQKFNYIAYEFGRMPHASFKQFQSFLYRDSEVILDMGESDKEYLYCVYYTPKFMKDKIDTVFSSLHFEKIVIPQQINGEPVRGTPLKNYGNLMDKIKLLDIKTEEAVREMQEAGNGHCPGRGDLAKYAASVRLIGEYARLFDYRKYAAKTPGDFFIFIGWMPEKESEALRESQEDDDGIVLIVEDDNEAILTNPPTKLVNNRFTKPFEFFVKMYGVPSYGETDPTPFVAITYTILFGIMFADIGQGLLLAAAGVFMHFKKMALGAVMTIIGISSAIFGAVFGSVFGYEFHSLFAPSEPHNINTTLLFAVGFGIFLILTSMIFNLRNCLKNKNLPKFFLDSNGLAGFVFYATVIFTALSFITGGSVPVPFIIVFAVFPIALVALRHPISRIVNKRKPFEASAGLSILELFIELFETLLTYFTNTVSFVRVGAFALSHASMMYVVWMLSETSAGQNNIFVLILGNLLVMALEGLIVGIQVLRLEFYEMFSRFYDGGGREFSPVNPVKKKEILP